MKSGKCKYLRLLFYINRCPAIEVTPGAFSPLHLILKCKFEKEKTQKYLRNEHIYLGLGEF